jgi:hypothetical protein
MFKAFYALLATLLNGTFSKILTGAGLGLFTSAVSQTLLTSLFDTAINSINSSSADILGLLHILGFDTFLSVVFGAIIARLTIQSFSLRLQKLN